MPAAADDARSELLAEALTAIDAIEDVDSRAETLSQLIADRTVEEREGRHAPCSMGGDKYDRQR